MNDEKREMIRQDAIRDMARDAARMTMLRWFRERYEDPAENTPYESAEGGYIYIWGGPYDAREVLWGRFGDEYEEDLIEEVVSELEVECTEWAAIPKPEDYDYQTGPERASDRANASLSQLTRALVEIRSNNSASYLYALLYAKVVTVVEAFLADVMTAGLKVDKYLRCFVETEGRFREEKMPVSAIFAYMERLRGEVDGYIANYVFHRHEKVSKMFAATYAIKFPESWNNLQPVFTRRHDIVHRNCRDRNTSVEFVIGERDVIDAAERAKKFIAELDALVAPLLEDNQAH